jgi:hypothetical protein
MRVARVFGAVYIASYIVISLAYVALFLAPGPRGKMERDRVIASEMAPWPNSGIASELSPARRMAAEFMRQNPGTVLLTSQKLGSFVWDPTLDRSRIFELSCAESMTSEVLSGPAHVVILTHDYGSALHLWADAMNLNSRLQFDVTRRYSRVECFERLPGLTLSARFPAEELKVLTAYVPANIRFILRP